MQQAAVLFRTVQLMHQKINHDLSTTIF